MSYSSRTGLTPTKVGLALVALLFSVVAFAVSLPGRAADPAFVAQESKAQAAGVNLEVEWVRYGGTATIARINGEAGGQGERVFLDLSSLHLVGFAQGKVMITDEDADGATLRLPPALPSAASHAITVLRVAKAGPQGISAVEGRWDLPLKLPPVESRAEAFAVETLEGSGFSAQVVSITATRSYAETLVTYTLAADVVPLGPPELVLADGSPVVGIEIEGTHRESGGGTHTVALPPTPFGVSIEVRMGPLGQAEPEGAVVAEIDLAARLGREPLAAEATEWLADFSEDPGTLSIRRVSLLGRPNEDKLGANLLLEVSSYLAGAQALGAVEIRPGGTTYSVADANGHAMKVLGAAAWTGTPPSSTSPGMPPGSEIAVLAYPHNDLSRLTVAVHEPMAVIQPDGVVSLRPNVP